MNANDLRALLKARRHSSFSAAPLIGASPDSIRNWSSGRRPIPDKYFPAIEKLPARPPGKRWSPAEIGHPVEDRLPAAAKSAGEAEAVPGVAARTRRRTRAQRLRDIGR